MAYNILIVDDSKIVRAVMRKTLSISGVDLGEVYEAANGREALLLLSEKWVDLVLADINMPEMTGLEMVDELKKTGLMETIPVVIVSTERSVTRMESLKAKGVHAYLNKPFTPEDIRDVVCSALDRKSGNIPKEGAHG